MTSFKQVKTVQDTETPCSRWGHSICALEDSLLLFGGYENSKYHKDLWKFDLKTLRWEEIQQKGEVPPPCSNFTMNLNNDKSKMIIMGGGTVNKEKINNTYELDLKSYVWKKMEYFENEALPWQRSYHCAEVIGKYLAVFGGQFFHDFDDLWLYNMETCHWTEVQFKDKDTKPRGRKFASSFKFQDKMYIVGGCENKYECIADIFYVDFERFLVSEDVSDLKWKELKVNKVELIRRWGHASAIKDNKAYIFGGRCGNKDLQNFVEIDLVTGKCSEVKLKANSIKGRRKPGLCFRNNTLFCFSGFDGSYLKDFIYIDLTQKPEYNKNKQTNPFIQGLKKEFSHYQPEELDYKFEKDVVNIELFEIEECLKYIDEHITKPISIKGFPGTICGQQFVQKSKYFEYLLKEQTQMIEIFRPENISNEQYELLVKTFVLYMEFGKILFHSMSFGQQLRIIPYLIQLAQYYLINQLKDIAQFYALQLFEQKVKSTRTEVKEVLDSAFDINELEASYGQYAGLFALKNLVRKMNVENIEQLEQLAHQWQEGESKKWTLSMIKHFNFELHEAMMCKEKEELENTKPQQLITASNKGQDNFSSIKSMSRSSFFK